MNVEWEIVRLKDVTSILGDGLHGTPVYDEAGTYYFINGNNLNKGKIEFYENTKKSTKAEYLKHKKDLNERTILVSINGTLGNVALYNGEPVILGKSACYFNVFENVNKIFVRYVVSSTVFQTYLESLATGTTIKNVSLRLMREFTFKLPPLEIQDKIASVLAFLDEKIALNTQNNQTLEAIAQAIFKSWFVDFDPVKAKMEVLNSGGNAQQAERAVMGVISGKDDTALAEMELRQPEAFAKLVEIAVLFPAEMVESELGLVPVGWKVTALMAVTTEIRRGLSPSYTEDVGVKVVNQKCIRNHSIDYSFARKHDAKKRGISGREIRIGDVLINSTGVGTLGRLAPVRYTLEPTVVDSHVTIVRADQDSISKEYLTGLMFMFESFIESSGAGSTGQTELRKEVLENISFAKPPLELSKKYEDFVGPISRQIGVIEKQESELSAIRDGLLPKLLSGEIDLSSLTESISGSN